MQLLLVRMEQWRCNVYKKENQLGLIFPAAVGLTVGLQIVRLSMFRWPKDAWMERSGWFLAGLLWLILDVPYLWRLSVVARQQQEPFALQAALKSRPPPLLLRPIVCLWWRSHFALIFGVVAFQAHAKNIPQMHMPLALHFFITACWGFAANGFLMLAVCAITSSERIRRRVWQFRVLTDFGLAFLSLGLR